MSILWVSVEFMHLPCEGRTLDLGEECLIGPCFAQCTRMCPRAYAEQVCQVAGTLYACRRPCDEYAHVSLGRARAHTHTQVIGAVYYGLSYPQIARECETLAEADNLTRLFEENYRMEIAEGDEFLLSIWNRVMPRLQLAMRTVPDSGVRARTHPHTHTRARISARTNAHV